MENVDQITRRQTMIQLNGSLEGRAVFGGLFSFVAIELLVLGFVLGAWIIFQYSFPGESGGSELIWGGLGLVAAAVSALYLLLSRQAIFQGRADYSRNLIAVAIVSGAVLLGVLLLSIAREFTSGPIVMDVRDEFAKPRSASLSVDTAAAVGDASKGAQWFAQSCVTCHGPTGDGVLHAAPSLRGSQFLNTADNTMVMSLIRMGRAATDPANKTGKVMPARGGNPFLDEAKIADLAAFVKQLDSQSGGGAAPRAANGTQPTAQVNAAPAAVLNHWVVPPATEVSAPSTLAVAKPMEASSFSVTKKAVDASRYGASFSGLFLIATSVIAFHFLWLTGTGTAVVLHRELQLPQSVQRSLARQTVLFWLVGLGWMMVWFGIFFLLG